MLFLIALAGASQAQTYTVGPGASTKPEPATGQTQKSNSQLGFGSNIQNARLARAAQLALQRGDRGVALDYARRAAQTAPNDPQMWFLVGYAARLDSRFEESIIAYKRGLHLSPSSLSGLSGLAQTLSLMGRIDEAEQILKQVLATNPNRREDALLLGNLYLRAGDNTNALSWLRRGDRLRPDARSALLLALTYQRLKQLDTAKHYLNLAKQRAPNNSDVQRSLAGYYREIGDYPRAIAALKEIQRPNPSVIAELAYTYQLAGNLTEAARLYTKAANAMPRSLTLQLSAAQAQIAAGSIDKADPFLKRATALKPDYYRLHSIRGEIAQLLGHDEEAVREYSAAITRLPASPVEGPLYGIQLHMNLQGLYKDLNEPVLSDKQLQIAQTEIGALNEQGADRGAFLRLRTLIKLNAGQADSALSDIKEALAISPNDPNNLQLDGDVLVKLGRVEDAIAVFKRVLAIDHRSRPALISLGYASRTIGNERDAEKYFNQLARFYPNLYVPYLALGDLYTAQREYGKAQTAYSKGHSLAPNNAFIVAGGMNAAIEARDLPLAGTWLHRLTPKMEKVPQVLSEKERYFSFTGNIQLSAELGRQALKVLPKNRDVVVYLGYDLLRLEKYDELLALTTKYMNVFPKEPDIPLLAGYVYKENGQSEKAIQAFTEALNRDPSVATAHVNRGYVFNDLRQPEKAEADFRAALKLEPKNGTAHLGLAFTYLELNRSQAAIRESQLAEKELGDSVLVHTIRATAYGREGFLTRVIAEYRAALKFTPNDGTLYLGMANAYYGERRFHDSVQQLQTAQKLLPTDPAVYALMARGYAHLEDRQQTMQNIALAERYAAHMPPPTSDNSLRPSDIYVSTGKALSTLGDQKAAMERFQKALDFPDSNRVSVRLAIAKVMARRGDTAGAERQIALAQLEAAAGETKPATGEEYIDAAGIFQQMHEYSLSLKYLDLARKAGASDIAVRVTRANSYLALGDTRRAAAELAAVKAVDGTDSDYAYLLAEGNLSEQEHIGTQALTSFAQASSAAGEDPTAEQGLLQAGAAEGFRINSNLSVLGNFTTEASFDDSTIYVLDSKLFGPVPVPPTDLALLPPPRTNLVNQGTALYHLHFSNMPTIGGFFQIRNSRGTISAPATNSVVNRDTTDYSMNIGLNPTLHLGRNALTFDTGFQGTIRRDSISPVQLNQNLFRAFAYLSTTSFFDVVSATGYLIYEAGPFTESDVHSKMLASTLNFRVGAPWGKTALVTGWGANDLQFTPVGIENYNTSSYIGLTRRFSTRWNAEALVEDLRAWRVVGSRSGNSQALRPAGTVDFSPNRKWDIQATASFDSTRSFHVYDMLQTSAAFSYVLPFGKTFNDQTGKVDLKYPIRFSAGFQEETFPNFSYGKNRTKVEPYVSITLF